MPITSVDEVSELVALRCSPDRMIHVRSLIARSGILLRGHFQLQSGLHSAYFIRIRGIATRPDFLEALAQELLLLIPGHNAQMILCPESAGFALAAATARLAALPFAVTKIDINRRPSNELRTGAIAPGSRVLLMNDVSTSGSSLRLLHKAAEAHGALAQGALILAAVGTGALKATNALGIVGSWLIEALWPLFTAENCELCQQEVPLTLSAELG